MQIPDQHQHTGQRDKHWSLGVFRMQEPQPANQG